jgi:hypothetical protein
MAVRKLEIFLRVLYTIKPALFLLPNVKGTTLTSKISLIQIPPTGALSLENIRTATCKQERRYLKNIAETNKRAND